MQQPGTNPPTDAHSGSDGSTLICFSHLRWDFVFQRPQHLMSRFARDGRVVFWEEPVTGDVSAPQLRVRTCADTGVTVVTPAFPVGSDQADQTDILRQLLDDFLATLGTTRL